MIHWKQRLYAFLLRRILGPFLDASATQKLHDSIDFSLHEGKFVLKEVSLNADYLTEKFDFKKVGLSIVKASIAKLEINLSLRENANNEFEDDSEVPQSSFAWKAIKFGTSSASLQTVSLIAEINIDGISLVLETGHIKTRKSSTILSTTDEPIQSEEEESSSKSLIGSYIDAALASLQLNLKIIKTSVTVHHKNEEKEKESWVTLKLSSISYRDQDVSSRNNNDITSGCKTVFKKVVDFSDITIQSGEKFLEGSAILMKNQQSTIALARGSGQIYLRVFEYNSGSVARDGKCYTQQDVEVKLNHQLNLSIDEISMRQFKNVADDLASASEAGYRDDVREISKTSLAGSPLDRDDVIDQEDLKALTGIMKQYREAYHLAEHNHLKGGVLIPSNAYLDTVPLEDEESGDFDLFFDANDQSFYNATSVLAESIRMQKELTDNDYGGDFVNTKLRFHLLSASLKVNFRNPGSGFTRPEEYILITMNDLNFSYSSSKSLSESSLSISHIEIEDAQLDTSKKSVGYVSIGNAPLLEGVVDIGTLLGFASESNDGEHDLVVFEAPCVSLNYKKVKKTNKIFSIKSDATILPVEVCIRQRTMSNLSTFAAQLSELKSHSNSITNRQNVSSVDSKLQNLSFECSCPSITIGIPLVREVSTSPIFERHGEILCNVATTGPSFGILLHNTAVEWSTQPASDDDETLEESGMFVANHMLFFVQSPIGDKIVVDTNMQRTDIFVANGQVEVNPCIPISVVFKRNITESQKAQNGRNAFPLVPVISSFKARQEDDDEDTKIDKLLFSKLDDINAASRKELRGSDPQFSMVADSEKADFIVVVNIPEVAADFTKTELETLLSIADATTPASTSPRTYVDAQTQIVKEGPIQTNCFALNISKITLSLKEDLPKSSYGQLKNTFACVFAVDTFKAHLLKKGSATKHLRILAHEPCLYEVYHPVTQNLKKKSSRQDIQSRINSFQQRLLSFASGHVAPILYRSHLFTSISHESPTILFDYIDMSANAPTIRNGLVQKRLHVTLYHLTYRYDVNSKWIARVAGIVPQRSNQATDKSNDPSTIQNQEQSMIKVFFSLADFNVDYTPPDYFETISRSIVRVGDFRFSSNIMKPVGPTQAYSSSLGNFSFHVCSRIFSHERENSLLCRSSVMFKTAVSLQVRAPLPIAGPTPETLLRELGFVSVISLDMMDAIVVVRDEEKIRGDDPGSMTSLTFGTLSLNACKDSFNCFATTVGELNAKLTALSDKDIEDILKEAVNENYANVESTEPDKQVGLASKLTDGHFCSPSIEREPENNTHLLDGYDWTAIDHDPLPEPKIRDGDEQVAGWYSSSKDFDAESPSIGAEAPNIIQQHFPLHSISDPLSDGDMGASKLAGKQAKVTLKSRLVIHQLSVKFRFYDGYDWPDKMSVEQRKAAGRPNTSFVIEALSDSERLELKREDESTKIAPSEARRAKLMGDLLASPAEEASTTFSSAPLPEERAANIELQEKLRRFCRKSHLFFQISANGVTMRIDSYEKDPSHRLVNLLTLCVSDLFIAETASSPSPIKMLGEWVNEHEHPRDTRFGTLMFKMVTCHPINRIKERNEVESDDCEVTMQLLPMRCLLDQRAINFIRAFFHSDQKEGNDSEKWNAGLHYLPPPRFLAFRVKPWKVKVDYLPQKLDVAALREGSFVELINVSPIDGMVISLSQACVNDVVGFGLVGASLLRSWVQEICATQLHKFLANARPFEPFVDVGQGFTDLIVLPYEAFKNGDDIRRAMGSGIKSLAETFAFQTLTTTSRLTQYAANKMAGTVRGKKRVNVASNPLPSRPTSAPKGVGDVTSHAMESLARGFQAANYKVVIVPYREYAQNGATGAVTSVVRGVPVLLVAPLAGGAEALSYTLLGARNALRPDIRKEEEAIRNGITGYDT